jgi:hypothetical protein
MEDRPRGQQRLGGQEPLLHGEQVAVSQHDESMQNPGVLERLG